MHFDTLLDRANRLRRASARGRYAPSPTGTLHLGNARSAIVAWLQARLAGGRFVMRNEDIDRPRVVDGSAAQIYDDLYWLELDWDEGPDVGGPVGPYDQSQRTELYEQALGRLTDKNMVFQCFCSRKDIRQAASAPDGGGRVIYPGTCRFLTADQQQARRADHPQRSPSWRYRVPARDVHIEDVIAGGFSQQLDTDVGDFPLRRADELFAYQLAVVVDDALMGITDVVRGDDLLASTPRQVELYKALDLPAPRFWHIPLMHNDRGKPMSKRFDSTGVQALRQQGQTPTEVVGRLAASIGLAEPGEAVSIGRLADRLTLDEFKQALRGRH